MPKCICMACGLSFKSLASFDMHRDGKWENRRCLTKSELLGLGMAPDLNGLWRIPATEDKLNKLKQRRRLNR